MNGKSSWDFPGQGAGMQAALAGGELASPASPPAPWETLHGKLVQFSAESHQIRCAH